MDKIHHIHQHLASQQERTLESQSPHLVIFTCKDTFASGSVDRHLILLTFHVFQDHCTSEYITEYIALALELIYATVQL